jgi:hypothetical protein
MKGKVQLTWFAGRVEKLPPVGGGDFGMNVNIGNLSKMAKIGNLMKFRP